MKLKTKRLTRNTFSRAFRLGKIKSSPHFSLRVSPASSGEQKSAVVVSKKVAPTAVLRNTIRRRAYHILAHSPSGQHIILYARKGAEKLSYKAMEEEILSFWS